MVTQMISIHLYGDLRRFGNQPKASKDTIVTLPAAEGLTISRLLRSMGIPHQDVAQIFLNRQLLKPGSSMAPWLGYQTAASRIPAKGLALDTPIRAGDRLALFPRSMAMLVV